MNNKLIMLSVVIMIFVYSPAFAEDCDKGSDHCQQMKMGMDSMHHMQKQIAETSGEVKPDKAIMRKVTREEVGKKAVCPVMGNTFKVTSKTLSASYKGKVYYFCCPGCPKSFLKNPEKYVQKKRDSQAKTYACPMGDYQGDKPGKCPNCGMDLIEKK